MTYDTGNEAHVRRARVKAKLAIEDEIADLRSIMQTASGRRFMWRLLDKCGVYRTSFTGNSTTFFNEGQRNIGLWLIDQVNRHCLDEFTQMVAENQRGEPDD